MPKRTIKALQGTSSVFPGRSSDLSPMENAHGVLNDAYAMQLSTCDLLEEIADNLPASPHVQVSQSLISILQGSEAKKIIEEEERLFLFLEKEYEKNIFVVNFINRMRVERQQDEDLVSELVSALETILQTKTVREPESFGYMLRGFFEAKRRQIGLKKSVLLLLVEQTLKGET